ncbi:hypothetical protein MMC30_006992 [Trapelia coarctata]|nr:hypothetical protein [Trapelia coarctata]
MDTEEEYFVPLEDQRVFGAGIKRKRVNFVAATETGPAPPRASTTNGPAERYLSIVFSRPASKNLPASSGQGEATAASTQTESAEASGPLLCKICKLPIQSADDSPATSRPHEASIAHQVCLTHSHPPSHLDRNRPGVKYLSSYGWDPDSRLGLGATGEGIRIPIKGTPKNDTVGLGVNTKADGKKNVLVTKKIEKLDAGRVRREEERGRQKGEKLREMFYRSDEVERYLGGG